MAAGDWISVTMNKLDFRPEGESLRKKQTMRTVPPTPIYPQPYSGNAALNIALAASASAAAIASV